MDLTDLSGLDPAAARNYVLGYLTTLRVTRNRRRELEAAKRTWEGRIERAEAAAEPKLHAAATAELARVQSQLDRLLAEERELVTQVEVLGGQLRLVLTRANLTVDAEQLLAQLQALVGERDELAEDLGQIDSEQRAAAELEALKRRVQEE